MQESADGQPLSAPLEQKLEVIPLQAYLLVNLHFRDHQWVVPYLAGGYSYLLYRHEVDEGDTVQGHATGTHGRAGVKIYLNPWEPEAAEKARGRYGVKRTYLFVEVQVLHADPSGEADLSGPSYLGGVSVEF